MNLGVFLVHAVFNGPKDTDESIVMSRMRLNLTRTLNCWRRKWQACVISRCDTSMYSQWYLNEICSSRNLGVMNIGGVFIVRAVQYKYARLHSIENIIYLYCKMIVDTFSVVQMLCIEKRKGYSNYICIYY